MKCIDIDIDAPGGVAQFTALSTYFQLVRKVQTPSARSVRKLLRSLWFQMTRPRFCFVDETELREEWIEEWLYPRCREDADLLAAYELQYERCIHFADTAAVDRDVLRDARIRDIIDLVGRCGVVEARELDLWRMGKQYDFGEDASRDLGHFVADHQSELGEAVVASILRRQAAIHENARAYQLPSQKAPLDPFSLERRSPRRRLTRRHDRPRAIYFDFIKRSRGLNAEQFSELVNTMAAEHGKKRKNFRQMLKGQSPDGTLLPDNVPPRG